MALFTIILPTSISDEYSNRPLPNIRDVRCSMHGPRSITSNIIVYAPPVPNSAFMVYISAIITHITHYKSCWTFCVGSYSCNALWTLLLLRYGYSSWCNSCISDSEPQAGFDPPIIMSEGIYLNLMLTNNLSHRGWISLVAYLVRSLVQYDHDTDWMGKNLSQPEVSVVNVEFHPNLHFLTHSSIYRRFRLPKFA